MTIKLHKIPDKIIFRLIFALLILWNLKYFFLIFQIPFTMLFADYLNKNTFYSQVKDIRESVKEIKNFQDDGEIGFVSSVPSSGVFDEQDSIRDFYITQYAVVPSVLKNDSDENYVIGVYNRNKVVTPKGFELVKKINNRTYLYKKVNR